MTWSLYISLQFSNWLDALILVFSCHDMSSLSPLANIYQSFQEGRGQEVPILIVGTMGKWDWKCRVNHMG